MSYALSAAMVPRRRVFFRAFRWLLRAFRFFDRGVLVEQIDGGSPLDTSLLEGLLQGGFQAEDGRLRLSEY